MNADKIIKEYKENCAKYSGGIIDLKGAITGLLNRACGGDANRYMLLKVLTGKTSSKLLTNAEWYGLLCLVGPEKPVGGKWQSSRSDSELWQICQNVIRKAVEQPGQQVLPF